MPRPFFDRCSRPLLVLVFASLACVVAAEQVIISPALRSAKKGVGWHGSAGATALPKLQVEWAYSWWYRNYGDVPKLTEYVPMILDSEVVNKNPGMIAETRAYGRFLLGFNEPDQGDPDKVSVDTALGLWPQFIATGMRLGSPVMAGQADLADGWLDRFMRGAEQKGYRVDVICVHAYIDQYEPEAATGKLLDYLKAIHARYQKPIWLTEFALANYWKKIPATEDEQIAFMAKALPMLESLEFVERYAWFHLGSKHPDALIEHAQLCDENGELTRIGCFYRDAVLRVPPKPPARVVIRATAPLIVATPPETVTDAWRTRLLESIRANVAAGKTISYFSSFMKKTCTVLAVSGSNQLTVLFDHDSRFELAWSKIDTSEAAAMAQAMIGNQDWQGNALAAYFVLLGGDALKAAPFLDRSGVEATALRELFALNAIATSSPGAPPSP
jgi:Glycosyl hydrolase catalytic core